MPLTQLEAELRAIARERIGSGHLACLASPRMWGGRGSGKVCDLYDREIRPEEAELEVEGRTNEAEVRSLRFHVVCQSVWQLECARVEYLGAFNNNNGQA